MNARVPCEVAGLRVIVRGLTETAELPRGDCHLSRVGGDLCLAVECRWRNPERGGGYWVRLPNLRLLEVGTDAVRWLPEAA